MKDRCGHETELRNASEPIRISAWGGWGGGWEDPAPRAGGGFLFAGAGLQAGEAGKAAWLHVAACIMTSYDIHVDALHYSL